MFSSYLFNSLSILSIILSIQSLLGGCNEDSLFSEGWECQGSS